MTSDERHEMAERLRALLDDDLDFDDSRSDVSLTEVEVALRLLDGFYDNSTKAEYVQHLADLIDPTCKLRFDAVHDDFVCSACAAKFDHFQTYDGHGRWNDMRYCPNCGARVVTDDD